MTTTMVVTITIYVDTTVIMTMTGTTTMAVSKTIIMTMVATTTTKSMTINMAKSSKRQLLLLAPNN